MRIHNSSKSALASFQKAGATVTAWRKADFYRCSEVDSFDLVVLCHSLSDEDRRLIAKDIHSRWPQSKMLLVSAVDADPHSIECDVDVVMPSLEPEQLLRSAVALLAKHPAAA